MLIKSKQRLTQQKSPHIYRKFTAWPSALISIILWLSLITILALNITALSSDNQAKIKYRQDILSNNRISAKHVQLAEIFWLSSLPQEAKKELAIADSLMMVYPQPKAVLGLSTQDLLDSWEKNRHDLLSQFDYWSNIAADKPDFRDAWLALAVLAYDMNRPAETREFLTKAKQLDPNNSNIASLERDLGID